MISRRGAKKTYSGDTPVIHKGDAGWTSDRPDRKGESWGHNPMASVRHRRESNPIVPLVAPERAGERVHTNDGRHVYEWVSVSEFDPQQERSRIVWRFRSTHRNAAL